MIGPKRLEEITERGSTAFWAQIARDLPECNIEALDVGTILVLQWQMKACIEQYITASAKLEESGPEEEQTNNFWLGK
jgi:hypothetical protein